jgi:lysozyme
MTSSERQLLREQLIRHEGIRLRAYVDTVGKVTIGVGRNISDNGITYDEALLLLDHDIDSHVEDLVTALPWVSRLDPVRFRAMADLVFNMGIMRLLGFVHTLAAMERGDYETAANGLLESKYARQVGRRAETVAQMIRVGTVPPGTLVA